MALNHLAPTKPVNCKAGGLCLLAQRAFVVLLVMVMHGLVLFWVVEADWGTTAQGGVAEGERLGGGEMQWVALSVAPVSTLPEIAPETGELMPLPPAADTKSDRPDSSHAATEVIPKPAPTMVEQTRPEDSLENDIDAGVPSLSPVMAGFGELPPAASGERTYALLHVQVGQILHGRGAWACCVSPLSSAPASGHEQMPEISSGTAASVSPVWAGWRLLPGDGSDGQHTVLGVALEQSVPATHMLALAQAAQRLLSMQPAWPLGTTWDAPLGDAQQEPLYQWRSEAPDVLRLAEGRVMALRLSVVPLDQAGQRMVAWFNPELSPWPVRVKVDMPSGQSLEIVMQAHEQEGEPGSNQTPLSHGRFKP